MVPRFDATLPLDVRVRLSSMFAQELIRVTLYSSESIGKSVRESDTQPRMDPKQWGD